MMLPKYQDTRVCAFCGAPAYIIGEEFRRGDGTVDLIRKPVEIRCRDNALRADQRTRVRAGTDRRSVERELYHVQVFEYVCTREAGLTVFGHETDDKELAYACGALMKGGTKVVAEERMPGWTKFEEHE